MFTAAIAKTWWCRCTPVSFTTNAPSAGPCTSLKKTIAVYFAVTEVHPALLSSKKIFRREPDLPHIQYLNSQNPYLPTLFLLPAEFLLMNIVKKLIDFLPIVRTYEREIKKTNTVYRWLCGKRGKINRNWRILLPSKKFARLFYFILQFILPLTGIRTTFN